MDNPQQYLNRKVKIKRLGKTIEANIIQVGKGKFFKGIWLDEYDKPCIGMIPFKEIEDQLKTKKE